jgi:hypothetical protein
MCSRNVTDMQRGILYKLCTHKSAMMCKHYYLRQIAFFYSPNSCGTIRMICVPVSGANHFLQHNDHINKQAYRIAPRNAVYTTQ